MTADQNSHHQSDNSWRNREGQSRINQLSVKNRHSLNSSKGRRRSERATVARMHGPLLLLVPDIALFLPKTGTPRQTIPHTKDSLEQGFVQKTIACAPYNTRLRPRWDRNTQKMVKVEGRV